MAKTSNKTTGIFCILLSGLCFTGMNTFVRLSGDLPTMQKVFFRNFVAMIFAFVMMVRKKDSWPQTGEHQVPAYSFRWGRGRYGG